VNRLPPHDLQPWTRVHHFESGKGVEKGLFLATVIWIDVLTENGNVLF